MDHPKMKKVDEKYALLEKQPSTIQMSFDKLKKTELLENSYAGILGKQLSQ